MIAPHHQALPALSRHGRAIRDMFDCPGCRTDFGYCPRHQATAQQHALAVLDHLALEPDRRAHTIAVGRRMARMLAAGDLSPLTRDIWSAAATLHDVGYAAPDTGHHAIDGAALLADTGFPGEVVALVAHHSTSRFEAEARGLAHDLHTRFGSPPPLAAAALWVADFTTSRTGEPVSVQSRLADIAQRYAPDSPARRALVASAADFADARALVAERL